GALGGGAGGACAGGGGLAAGGGGGAEPRLVGRAHELVAARVHEHADSEDEGWQRGRDAARGREVHPPRAARPEDEAHRVGPGLRSHPAVLGRRDPADLHGHPLHRAGSAAASFTSSRSAAPGSGAVMKCSPTRKASNPAPRSRRTSSPVRIPLSATATMSSGIRGARAKQG